MSFAVTMEMDTKTRYGNDYLDYNTNGKAAVTEPDNTDDGKFKN